MAAQGTDPRPVFTGVPVDGPMRLGNGMVARPFAQGTHIHVPEPTRNLEASFVSLAGACLLVEDARPAQDGAQVKPGFDLAVQPGVTLTSSFDGEFSGVGTDYGRRGGFRVNV